MILDSIAKSVESGISALTSTVVQVSPTYGDFILLGVSVVIARLLKAQGPSEGYNWMVMTILIFLILKFAGG